MNILYKLIFIAIMVGIVGLVLPIDEEQTINGVEWRLNNTNLAPTFDPLIPGTGERVNNTTYWANNTQIDIHVFSHAMNVSQTAATFLYINDTLVSPRSGRPLGGAETAYRGVDTVIPKGSYYRVLFTNVHHYEWREYQVLSGNVSMNITDIDTDNDSAYVNKSGDVLTGSLTSTIGDLHNEIDIANTPIDFRTTNITNGESASVTLSYNLMQLAVGNGLSSSIQMNNTSIVLSSQNGLDMSNGNITNCANCQVTGHGLARAYLNNSSFTVSTTTTRLILNNVSYNPYSEYSTVTGNFTVQETGYYDILSSVDFSNVTASNRYLAFIQKNNSIILLSSVHSSNVQPISAQMADTQLLHSGDIISIWATAPNGTTVIGTTSANTWMSISLKSKVPP